MNERHAEYDKAQVTPAADDPAVGRVGGVEDETFSREDGSEVRAVAAAAAAEAAKAEAAKPNSPPHDILG